MNNLNDNLISDKPALTSFILIFFFVVVIGFMAIGNLVGLQIGSLFYDGNLAIELSKAKPDEGVYFPVLIMLGTASLVGLIIIPVIYLTLLEHKSIKPFFSKSITSASLLLIPILGVCFLVAISPIIEWNMNFQFPEAMEGFGNWARTQEDQIMELTKLITNFDTPGKFAMALVVVALLPGIGEELVFRGLIQNEIWRGSKNIHVAIWVSAILFSAIHMQFFGFVPRLLLGAMFGYMYYWSGNMLVPMFAHIFHNGFTVTMIYLYSQGVTGINVDSEESAPLLLVAICGVLTFALLYIFRKQYTSPNIHDDQTSSQLQ